MLYIICNVESFIILIVIFNHMANYKSQNLAKIALWQHFMDNVTCFHPNINLSSLILTKSLCSLAKFPPTNVPYSPRVLPSFPLSFVSLHFCDGALQHHFLHRLWKHGIKKKIIRTYMPTMYCKFFDSWAPTTM
jgi:hypothetical protein